MGISTLHQKQLLPIHQVPIQQIPAFLICNNSLVRAGIRHILNGTRYVVAGDVEGSSKPYSADALPEVVADLIAQCPSARVVVLTDHLDPATMMRALHAGVNGLCSTSMDRGTLLKALDLVMLGETFIASALVLTILDEASQAHESGLNITSALTPTNDTATSAHNLSSREVEILKRLMEGESNKVIARKLDIAEATIKVHIKSILRKVQVKNRTQAALWATAHLSAPSNAREGGC
jgi:two-component system nitrate/nitrite response regulator NarL